ncbi:MAG: AMP-binding protein [Christensenellales bacterium]
MYEKYLAGKTRFESYEDFIENYKLKVPDTFNYAYDVVDVLAKEQPDKRALLWCNVKGEDRAFTFAQIKMYTDKTAHFFKKLGIKKGDMVMLILKRHYEFWFCILALHKIGAIAIPATNLLTKKDIVYRNQSASVKMIVCTTEGEVGDRVLQSRSESPALEHIVTVKGTLDGCIDYWEGVNEAPDDFMRPTGEEDTCATDPMLLYFTSGTTGMPKMVLHDFAYPLGHIITGVFWHNPDPDGLHLTVADTGWAKAVWGKLYGQWLAQTTIMVYDFDKFVPLEMLAVIEKYKVTSFCAPPTIYRYMLGEDMSRFKLSLKYATTAGEALNPEVFEKFKRITGISLMEGFGQTEMTVATATYPWVKPKPGSMGKPSPGYDLHILNDDGKECRAGETGEIVLNTQHGKPTGMFMGYYRDEQLTKSVWHDGYYHTGDVAWKDERGFLWFVSRTDDVIKSSGYRIGPFEVESALLEHPAVLEAAIVGVPHPERGQVIKATIVLAKGYEPSEELKKELQVHVQTVTAPYKYPRIIEFVPELPKTISGKIRRVELRK